MSAIQKREHLMKLQESLIKSNQITTCTNCEFWKDETETCEKYKARPPAKVIVVGCIEHIDGIPF